MSTPAAFEDVQGLVVVLAFIFGLLCVVAFSRLSLKLKLLIYAGLALRVVGSWLRYTVMLQYYQSYGDSWRYYTRGLAYAERFWVFDFSPFVDPTLWLRGQWWGTSFVSFPSGLVLAAIGPSLRAEYLAFSLLAFLGLGCFALAFRSTGATVPVWRYARWIWLFPSLWYWPSVVGKDALILLGMGLAVAGFVRPAGRPHWPPVLFGLFIVFAIRPQVAAVVILSFILAYWLSSGSHWTLNKTVQGTAIFVAGLAGIWLSMRYVGVDAFDIEGVQSYIEAEATSAAGGTSAIEGAGVGLHAIPLALINILFRPFIWEAHNGMALISAVEILSLWIIVWLRRRNLMAALRLVRAHPLVRIAVPFILVYSISLGMIVSNLGIIARQRIFLFPFLFLLLEAVPARRDASAGAWVRRLEGRKRFTGGCESPAGV